MTHILETLARLRRPRLLVSAARCGQADYRRSLDLPRILRMPQAPAPARAAAILLEMEEMLDDARRTQDAGYNAGRHVEVLIALLAEARLASEDKPRPVPETERAPAGETEPSPRPAQPKASDIDALRLAT